MSTPDPRYASGREAIADDVEQRQADRQAALDAVAIGAQTEDDRLYAYCLTVIEDSDSRVTKRLNIVKREMVEVFQARGNPTAPTLLTMTDRVESRTLKLAQDYVLRYEVENIPNGPDAP